MKASPFPPPLTRVGRKGNTPGLQPLGCKICHIITNHWERHWNIYWGGTQMVTPMLWQSLRKPPQAMRQGDTLGWFSWKKHILIGTHASRATSPSLAGWGLCGGYSPCAPSPHTHPSQAPRFLLSLCPHVFQGYMRRVEHRNEKAVYCKEAIWLDMLKFGLQHLTLRGGAVVAPSLPTLPPCTQCHPFPCSLTLTW